MSSIKEFVGRFWLALGDLIRQRPYLVVGAGLLLVAGGVYFFQLRSGSGAKVKGVAQPGDVLSPAIVNGELVLPKVTNGNSPGLANVSATGLQVLTANLIGLFDQSQKLTGIRILGEVNNFGGRVVTQISPVVKFMTDDGKAVGQKVGRMSQGFDFFSLAPSGKTLYDITVDDPPKSDKLEILINVAAASESAVYEPLKVASRSVEVKSATYQSGNQNTQAASASAGGVASLSATTTPEQIEYYTVSGSVVDPFSDPVSEIAIYAWVKDENDKVFSFGRQDFRNDLLASGDKIDFRINLLPFKTGEKYGSFEIAAWAKRYRLGQ